MHQPDISNAAQEAQERASAIDAKRAALEFDQTEPRVGPDGWSVIGEEEESARPMRKSIDVKGRAIAAVGSKVSGPGSAKSSPEPPPIESRFSRMKRFLSSLIRPQLFLT